MKRKIEQQSKSKQADKHRDICRDIWDQIDISVPVKKKHISIRIDEDVLAWFQAQGRGYQRRMNAVLRSFMEAAKGGLDSQR